MACSDQEMLTSVFNVSVSSEMVMRRPMANAAASRDWIGTASQLSQVAYLLLPRRLWGLFRERPIAEGDLVSQREGPGKSLIRYDRVVGVAGLSCINGRGILVGLQRLRKAGIGHCFTGKEQGQWRK